MADLTDRDRNTCATCEHIGRMYWHDGLSYTHHCGKGDERRAESMPAHADIFAHFRASFDAEAQQPACRHYQERPGAQANVVDLLALVKSGGELRLFTDENRLAESLDGKFVRYDSYAKTSHPGGRVYRLLPVGEAELARATRAGRPAQGGGNGAQ